MRRRRPKPAESKRPQPKRFFALNKPFQVLCQFRDPEGRRTLSDFIDVAHVYAAGRLDFDSEGLLMLSGDGALSSAITEPREKLVKHYWAQLEGVIANAALEQLRRGVELRDGVTAPAEAIRIAEPEVMWPREPPIRERKNSPTSWIDLGIREGRNRQVRRMTAAVGFPTLRLVRHAVGPWALDGLAPGEVRELPFPAAWLASRSSRVG
jgi:23S rRNA pseudouridine2457 synthase